MKVLKAKRSVDNKCELIHRSCVYRRSMAGEVRLSFRSRVKGQTG